MDGFSTKAAASLGYSALKDKQVEIITSVLEGKDVFGILPTGYGKTLCFTALPAAFDLVLGKESGHSIVIVVSPLKALMEDQVSIIQTWTSML